MGSHDLSFLENEVADSRKNYSYIIPLSPPLLTSQPSPWQAASAGPLPALSCPLMATLEPASDQSLSPGLKVQQPREVGLVLNLVCLGPWERDRRLDSTLSQGAPSPETT